MRIPRTSMWRVIVTLMLILPALATTLPTVSGQDGKTINLQIIVDQSGSMAAATDTGTLRIDAAKTVLNEVIAQIPEAEGVNVGLRVYGHRGNNQPAGQAESCVSSDLLVPMQGVDKASLTTQVNALQPVGWTPLGYALEQAANDFTEPASENVVNAIIMVTDGLETCGADPAAVATQLKNSTAGITTHVIGFGTKPEELAILQSITQASGGQLLDSANAGQLMAALFEILEDLEVVEETGTGEARNSPLGVGRIGRVGDFEVSVISVNKNATEAIIAASPYTERPVEGNQFFQVELSITYVGSTSMSPAFELSTKSVGNSSVSYDPINAMCNFVVEATSLYMATELFTGGTAEYTVCWDISSGDADSLVMYIEPTSQYNADPVWFSLGNPIEIIVDPAATTEPETPTPPTPSPTTSSATTGGSEDHRDSSRESPLPVGQTGQVGDFEITVLSTSPNALSELQAYDSYIQLPEAGTQYFMVRVQVKYVGSSTGNPSYELGFQSVGGQSKSYSSLMSYCNYGNIPDGYILATELFQGGSAEYNICWTIDSVDQDSLVMYVEPLLQYNADPVWFSLQP
jgi:hypothetical protein